MTETERATGTPGSSCCLSEVGAGGVEPFQAAFFTAAIFWDSTFGEFFSLVTESRKVEHKQKGDYVGVPPTPLGNRFCIKQSGNSL